ncbi:hypothetical protein [Streptomyces sp. NPDC046985]|uniref:hypothetical protein n=1 Tax=Streptomyces sp. NPDC046985 TaxID=3155377 RepID=UPI0033F911A0
MLGGGRGGDTYRLRKLTEDGDDNAVIYVDQSVMNVLKWQKQRQDAERERLGSAWVDHDLVFARDGFKLYRGEAGGPQDPRRCRRGGAPGYTMARYGHSRKDGARRLAVSGAGRLDLFIPGLTRRFARLLVMWSVTPQPEKQKNPT